MGNIHTRRRRRRSDNNTSSHHKSQAGGGIDDEIKSPPNSDAKLEDFDVLCCIGSGMYAKVYLVSHNKTQVPYAMKVLCKAKYDSDDCHEKDIMESLYHPLMLNLMYSFESEHSIYLLLEFCNGGDFLSLIAERKRLTEKEAKFYAAQLVLAIEYLHRNEIIHRDVKPENILLDFHGNLKLCDLGLSKDMSAISAHNSSLAVTSSAVSSAATPSIWHENELTLSRVSSLRRVQSLRRKRTNTYCGTSYYLAPEMVLGRQYGFSVDWWGLGVFLFQVMAGDFPFFSDNQNELFQMILYGEPYLANLNCSKNAKDLISSLLQKEEAKRLGHLHDAEDIKRHPFFKGVNWKKMAQLKVRPPISTKLKDVFDTTHMDEIVLQQELPECMLKRTYSSTKLTFARI